MKKQSLLFFLLACTFSTFAMSRRGRVYAEGEQRIYGRCSERLKHAFVCPCCSLCKWAIKGAKEGNPSLLRPHLPGNLDNETGSYLFNKMWYGKNRVTSPTILALLIEKGFDPRKRYAGAQSALFQIIKRKDADSFDIATQYKFEDQEECIKIFDFLCTSERLTPAHQCDFLHHAIQTIAQKNAGAASEAIRRRALERRATVDSEVRPERIRTGRHSVPDAWNKKGPL
jgi:hypothetical protein